MNALNIQSLEGVGPGWSSSTSTSNHGMRTYIMEIPPGGQQTFEYKSEFVGLVAVKPSKRFSKPLCVGEGVIGEFPSEDVGWLSNGATRNEGTVRTANDCRERCNWNTWCVRWAWSEKQEPLSFKWYSPGTCILSAEAAKKEGVIEGWRGAACKHSQDTEAVKTAKEQKWQAAVARQKEQWAAANAQATTGEGWTAEALKDVIARLKATQNAIKVKYNTVMETMDRAHTPALFESHLEAVPFAQTQERKRIEKQETERIRSTVGEQLWENAEDQPVENPQEGLTLNVKNPDDL